MAKKQKKGRTAKNAKSSTAAVGAEEALKAQPHTFVFHRGMIGKNIRDLERDLRKVMEPFTAGHLRVTRRNVLKDFVTIAGPLNVSHFMVLSKSEMHVNMRVVCLPRGPTLTFRVHQYALSKDVVSAVKRPHAEQKQFQCHPLLIMNNFNSNEMHTKLVSTMFQNMFPSINVGKIKLNQIQRCVLINSDDQGMIQFRHYNIRTVPVGISKGVKKMLKPTVPDLSKYNDISEFLLKGGDLSESEAEFDAEQNEVVLPDSMPGRGNIKAAKSVIKLTEIGPRMTLQLVKIEEGVAEGTVLFHKFVTKSEAEIKAYKEKRNVKKLEKDRRKKQQTDNVLKKQKLKEEMKQKSIDAMRKTGAYPAKKESDSEEEDDYIYEEDKKRKAKDDSDDDADYFRKEVGEEPGEEFYLGKSKTNKKRNHSTENVKGKAPYKKKKKY